MDVDSDSELLTQIASGGSIESASWPDVRDDILTRLDKIAREEFPIPKLPPPKAPVLPETDAEGRLVSPIPSSPPSQSQEARNDEPKPEPEAQTLEPGQLPEQIEKMLSGVMDQLKGFEKHPPSTIQRLAELMLRPRAHYKSLAPYLHAVDRVVMITSDAGLYPLPPAYETTTSEDPAEAVSWANPTNANGSNGAADEEALGGAILTPISWVKQHQPAAQEPSEPAQGAQIHSESTETIDGPNGMGRIETVSVSVNGIHSTGHARGITQGELLRQEQKAGVVPMSQLHRPQQQRSQSEDVEVAEEIEAQKPEDSEEPEKTGDEKDKDEEEHPHARGPEEIGVGDTGLQSQSTSYIGEGGLDAQGIDVEAAVGRKHEDEDEKIEAQSPDSDASGVKREAAESEVEPPAKKVKEDDEMGEDKPDADKMDIDKTESDKATTDEKGADKTEPDKMDTDKKEPVKPETDQEAEKVDEDKMETDKEVS